MLAGRVFDVHVDRYSNRRAEVIKVRIRHYRLQSIVAGWLVINVLVDLFRYLGPCRESAVKFIKRPCRSRLITYRWLLIGSLVALGAIIDLKPGWPWLGSTTVLVFPFASLIVSAALADGALARLLSVRPLVFLRDASYAIYIAHAPLLQWWLRIPWRSAHLFGPIDFIFYLALVIGVSALILNVVEKDARRWITESLALADNNNTNLARSGG